MRYYKHITAGIVISIIVNVFGPSAFANTILDEFDANIQIAYVSKDAAGGLKVDVMVEGEQDAFNDSSLLEISSKTTRFTVAHDNRYGNGIKNQDYKFTRMQRSKKYVPFGYMLMGYEGDYRGTFDSTDANGYEVYGATAKWEYYPGNSTQLLSELLFNSIKMSMKIEKQIFGQKVELSGMNNREIYQDVHFQTSFWEDKRVIIDRIIRMRYKDAYYRINYDIRHPEDRIQFSGEFVDNLTYLKVPDINKYAGTDGNDRYEFIGWQVTGDESQIDGPGYTEDLIDGSGCTEVQIDKLADTDVDSNLIDVENSLLNTEKSTSELITTEMLLNDDSDTAVLMQSNVVDKQSLCNDEGTELVVEKIEEHVDRKATASEIDTQD